MTRAYWASGSLMIVTSTGVLAASLPCLSRIKEAVRRGIWRVPTGSIGSSLRSTSPLTAMLMMISSVKSALLVVSTVPGSFWLSSFSTFTAPAMTMKNSMMTNTTSIIGAIWNPRLPSPWALGSKRFMLFLVGGGKRNVADARLGGGVHDERHTARGAFAITADDHSVVRVFTFGSGF